MQGTKFKRKKESHYEASDIYVLWLPKQHSKIELTSEKQA